jgi:hypothetical protein
VREREIEIERERERERGERREWDGTPTSHGLLACLFGGRKKRTRTAAASVSKSISPYGKCR